MEKQTKIFIMSNETNNRFILALPSTFLFSLKEIISNKKHKCTHQIQQTNKNTLLQI